MEGLVPAQSLLGQSAVDPGDALADFFFLAVEAGADDFDLGGAVGLDDSGNGIAEQQ